MGQNTIKPIFSEKISYYICVYLHNMMFVCMVHTVRLRCLKTTDSTTGKGKEIAEILNSKKAHIT